MKANDWRKLAEMVDAVKDDVGGPTHYAFNMLSSLMATHAVALELEEARTNLTAKAAGCVVPNVPRPRFACPSDAHVWSEELQGWVLPSTAPRGFG